MTRAQRVAISAAYIALGLAVVLAMLALTGVW